MELLCSNLFNTSDILTLLNVLVLINNLGFSMASPKIQTIIPFVSNSVEKTVNM